METIPRICLTGPESTGKTDLAGRLAKHFGTTFVPEFSRGYAEARSNELTYADVEPIARGVTALPPAPILDTDLISTVVYSRHYYGDCPPWIVDEARARRADLYLLMDTEVEWRPDPARDRGGEEREELFDSFRRALDEFETRWVIISGDWEERFERALAEIALFTGL